MSHFLWGFSKLIGTWCCQNSSSHRVCRKLRPPVTPLANASLQRAAQGAPQAVQLPQDVSENPRTEHLNSNFLRKVRQDVSVLAGRFAGISRFPMIPRSRDRADRKGPAAMRKSPKAGRQRMHVNWQPRPETGFRTGHFNQLSRDFCWSHTKDG